MRMHAYAGPDASPSDPRTMCGEVPADGLRDCVYADLVPECALITCPACLRKLLGRD